jgi:hypothetical protein
LDDLDCRVDSVTGPKIRFASAPAGDMMGFRSPRDVTHPNGANPMKARACIIFLAAATAWGVGVGDTYPQVLAKKGTPSGSIVAGSLQVLNYPNMTIRLKDGVVVSVKAVADAPPPLSSPPAGAPAPGSPAAQVNAVASQINDAVRRIVAIVNQPITHLPRTPGMKIATYAPGWFHQGATRPDFNNVDITKTQALQYSRYEYVSSDLNPTEAFLGSELEFNSMTKYFYTDRTLPKKRLAMDEMLEINRLYRVIGQGEQQLKQLGFTGAMP